MDLARKAQYFTLDVIFQLAHGQAFGNLENDEDMHQYIESTEALMEVTMMACTTPWLRWMFAYEWVGNLIFPSDKASIGIGKMIG